MTFEQALKKILYARCAKVGLPLSDADFLCNDIITSKCKLEQLPLSSRKIYVDLINEAKAMCKPKRNLPEWW